jgi:signal transduction histidine kinase
VSHDLRSPLNAILGFTELARLEDVSPEQEMSLDIIERRGRELLALIETILDAARLDAQRLSLMREPVNIGGLLGDAASKARDLAGEREMKVVVQVAPDLPRVVVVDSARVARAIGMLIGHAMRSADRSPIDVRADLRGADLVIEIDVISQRVSAQRLESMLGATTQSAGEQHRGLALGLRLARTVIELHSGTVTVVPHDAPGARFVVVLPTTASGDEPPPSSRRFA